MNIDDVVFGLRGALAGVVSSEVEGACHFEHASLIADGF